MNDSSDARRFSTESQSPANPYAAPSLIDEPARPGVDFADAHMPRWMRVREFFVVHIVAALSTGVLSILTQFFQGGPMVRPWYVTAVGIPAFLGIPCMFAAPGRALFLLYLGVSRDRHLLWFAFGHFVLTVVQALAWYLCRN